MYKPLPKIYLNIFEYIYIYKLKFDLVALWPQGVNMTYVAAYGWTAHLSVQSEAVVYPSWKNDQVSRHHLDPDPPVLGVSDVKVSASFQDEANLLIGVKVLLKKHPYLRTDTI